ncbi:hypothetical protein [Agromyces subbeticus]|uniref:hypothetical protein n=1 Tax=Agromyces subbeticus TaxID=293890 RepID=UPI0003B46ECB|nr:hypothetical protein [Agromyces subbeticus]
MIDERRTVVRRIGTLGGILLVASFVVAGLATADRAAWAEETAPGENLTVDVSDGVVPPTGRPTAPPKGPPITPPGRPGAGQQGSGAFVDTAGAPAAVLAAPPAADEVSLGGVLFVGGLAGGYSPSLDPLAGQLQVWFTVRNASKSTIDGSADFWLEGPFGNRISQVDAVEVAALEPGEKRTISATLPGVGQWTFVTVHTRFTPPAQVDNAELSPFTRDANVFAPPWLIGVGIVVGLGFAAIGHFLRRVGAPLRLGEAA